MAVAEETIGSSNQAAAPGPGARQLCDPCLGAGDIAPETITDLSSSGTQSLIVRFNPTARGALLEV